MKHYQYLIAGAGIIGLTIARELKKRFSDATIAVIEKEEDVARHASGRNSGVLHAGFYYTADSLKAKFTKRGNKALTQYCLEKGLSVHQCGKVVIARDEKDLEGLEELKRRAEKNGVELIWVDEKELKEIEPNAVTYQKALYSPSTSTVNPVEVCQAIKKENIQNGVDFYFCHPYRKVKEQIIFAGDKRFSYDYFINAAGLYADKIAQDFGFGKDYMIIPFKGNYMKYEKNKEDIQTNIYPVPNLKNPFLGVHFTKMVDGTIKIGPTATPAFWRENYQGWSRFRLSEAIPILYYQAKLFVTNSFHFRSLAWEEIRKYRRSFFIGEALEMVRNVDPNGFADSFSPPGIRAQLLNKKSLELVQDFIVEGDKHSIHILNAVSPAFTCSMPFAEYVVDRIVEWKEKRG
ncbi:L-2-hydroxyglutarate oxidase [Thermoflavimicrobium dichotomicum]|uniref:L-2-hydroxyglutarate oxidase LhgO n=1 Tax=Thermoflavimicrobium dichotomicum TaxID=46223 RepID=A0A1I3U7D5_9BACL|nr:L-2-hydroxyglutarate oxidase [Thermoflavimicrobium dichotomicum]SFJ78815.1 L-2-hydroxyglutarate oxidase LhgO [Thermoflavimicrobium dichotomicum]